MNKHLCLILLWACTPALHQSAKEPPPGPERFAKTIDAWARTDRHDPPPADCTMFLGSSSIRRWNTLAEDFPGVQVLNRGFGGSKTSDVLHFFDKLIPAVKPARIVFYCGENDIAKGAAPEVPALNWKRFVKLVRTVRPDTEFYYIPIKPNPKRWDFWPKYKAANRLIEAHCKTDPRLTYLGGIPGNMLGPNGKPRPCIFAEDRLHLNAAGYKIWAEQVRNALGSP